MEVLISSERLNRLSKLGLCDCQITAISAICLVGAAGGNKLGKNGIIDEEGRRRRGGKANI